MGGGGGGGVHHPLHNFSPKVGGGRLHGNGCLQGTLQYSPEEGERWKSQRQTCPQPPHRSPETINVDISALILREKKPEEQHTYTLTCHNTDMSQHRHVTTQTCHNTDMSQHRRVTTQTHHRCVTTQMCHNTDVSQHRRVTTQTHHNTDVSPYV